MMLSILIIFSFLVTACVTTDQNIQSLSSSYDGLWEGYTDTPEGRFSIKIKINNGMVTGYVDDSKISGYVEADHNLVIKPFSVMGAQVILDATHMSPERIEGIAIVPESRPTWFIEKKSSTN